MLRIAVGKEWVITSDAQQFILNQKKQVKSGAKAGDEWLDAVGYYPTISQLVNGLIHHHVRSSTANSMAGLAAEIGRIGQLCQEAFASVRAEDK